MKNRKFRIQLMCNLRIEHIGWMKMNFDAKNALRKAKTNKNIATNAGLPPYYAHNIIFTTFNSDPFSATINLRATN